MSLPVNLPMPSAEEAERFADLYEERFGVRPSPYDAFDALRRLVAYVYLTEYAPRRPLRPDDGTAGPEARRAWDCRLRAAKASATRRQKREAALDHDAWYRSLGETDRDWLAY
jgi:hypothetical protein